MQQHINTLQHSAILEALEELNHKTVDINGVKLEACKCYYYSLNPVHVLFNDNCPISLKHEIRAIFEQNDVKLPIAD